MYGYAIKPIDHCRLNSGAFEYCGFRATLLACEPKLRFLSACTGQNLLRFVDQTKKIAYRHPPHHPKHTLFSFYFNFIMILLQMEGICENTVAIDSKQNPLIDFVPVTRSGDWSDIGSREDMEDTHVCISDLAKKYGYHSPDQETVSFYGVSPNWSFFPHIPCANL